MTTSPSKVTDLLPVRVGQRVCVRVRSVGAISVLRILGGGGIIALGPQGGLSYPRCSQLSADVSQQRWTRMQKKGKEKIEKRAISVFCHAIGGSHVSRKQIMLLFIELLTGG